MRELKKVQVASKGRSQRAPDSNQGTWTLRSRSPRAAGDAMGASWLTTVPAPYRWEEEEAGLRNRTLCVSAQGLQVGMREAGDRATCPLSSPAHGGQ